MAKGCNYTVRGKELKAIWLKFLEWTLGNIEKEQKNCHVFTLKGKSMTPHLPAGAGSETCVAKGSRCKSTASPVDALNIQPPQLLQRAKSG